MSSAEAPPERVRAMKRNTWLLTVHHALMMSLFPMAIITIFQRDYLGLSVADIMVLQAIFGIALAVFEFPSGYLADRIGYRTSLVLASVLSVGGWGIYSAAQGFWSIAAAEIALGLSLSLVSGTNSAMLYESLAEIGHEEQFGTWYGRVRFFGQGAEGSAALVAGLLFAAWVRLPFVLQVALWVVNVGVAWALVEPKVHRPRIEDPLRHIGSLFTLVVRRLPRLRALFFVGIALSLATFVPVWLIQLYASEAGVPIAWLGAIWAVANYVVAIGSLASARTARQIGTNGTLLVCAALAGVGYFGLGATHALWGFAFYFAFSACRGLSAPVLAHEEQLLIPSGDRASLISMRSLLFRLCFAVAGPLIGIAIDARGQHIVLLLLGAVFVVLSLAGCAWVWRYPRPAEAAS
jgi:predicted MFS family arabinose efflux permease